MLVCTGFETKELFESAKLLQTPAQNRFVVQQRFRLLSVPLHIELYVKNPNMLHVGVLERNNIAKSTSALPYRLCNFV